jgi:hypothetical protein
MRKAEARKGYGTPTRSLRSVGKSGGYSWGVGISVELLVELQHSFTHSLSHSFNNHFSGIHSVPDASIGIEDLK